MSEQISVVIRTKDSAETLSDCLNSLEQQTQAIHEIVVVDSGSSDGTLEIASQFRCKVVAYPSGISFNYSKSLNLGIEQTSGDYVFILSSHSIAQNRNSLKWLLRCLEVHPNAPGCSLNKSLQSCEPVTSFDALQIEIVDRHNFRGSALSNTACLIRRRAWLERRYDETIATAEDIDWSLYYMKQHDQSMLRVTNDFVHYRNPVYSVKKDILELLYVAKLHYPRGRSWRRFVFELRSGLQLLFRDQAKAKPHLLYAYYLLLDRTIGIKRHTIPR